MRPTVDNINPEAMYMYMHAILLLLLGFRYIISCIIYHQPHRKSYKAFRAMGLLLSSPLPYVTGPVQDFGSKCVMSCLTAAPAEGLSNGLPQTRSTSSSLMERDMRTIWVVLVLLRSVQLLLVLNMKCPKHDVHGPRSRSSTSTHHNGSRMNDNGINNNHSQKISNDNHHSKNKMKL